MLGRRHSGTQRAHEFCCVTRGHFRHPREMVESGQPAPPFTLKDSSGHAWSLETLHAKGPVVVFFYPRDNSPFCTLEACAFRDGYEDFLAAGASVVGVSSDSEETHRGFSKLRRLPFLLLSDPGGSTRKAYR